MPARLAQARQFDSWQPINPQKQGRQEALASKLEKDVHKMTPKFSPTTHHWAFHVYVKTLKA